MPEPGLCQPSFERPRLLCPDYDGTIALTSETGPGIMSVNDSYAEAIDGLLGKDSAQSFIDSGGHGHRTPAEIISSLIDAPQTTISNFANEITATKLEILVNQIGRPLPGGETWPRFTEGFYWMWLTLSDDRSLSVDTAILSAGHTEFIKKTFDNKGMPQPDIIITDDVLTELGYGNLSGEDRAKPNTPMIDLAETIWLGRNKIPTGIVNRAVDIMFVGDDPIKDKGLAENAGVAWRLLKPTNSREIWYDVGRWASGMHVEAITYGK